MRELSAVSGVPVATIKYYLRERLLPAGERTQPNQSEYGQPHLRRLRLIRALIEVGGLSVASARAITGLLDLRTTGIHEILGLAQHAMAPVTPPAEGPEFDEARQRIQDLVHRLGWHVSPGNPGWTGAAAVLTTLSVLGQPGLIEVLEPYARAAAIAARADLDAVAAAGDQDSMVETAVVGMVVGEALTLNLRRMAQESVSSQRLFPTVDTAPGGAHPSPSGHRPPESKETR